MDDANLDSALKALANLSPYTELGVMRYFRDPDPQMEDTGIAFTVAELREILEAARGQAWRDASDPPSDSRLVWGQTHDGRELKARRILGGTWINIPAEPISVRRWRELPR